MTHRSPGRPRAPRRRARAKAIRAQRGGSNQLNLEEFLVSWLAAIRMALKPSTWDSYRANVTHHVIPHLGLKRLGAISPLDLNGLYVALIERGRVGRPGGLSRKTVHYIHTIIHHALRDAQRWGLIESNPAELCEPPRQTHPHVTFWTPEQARSFIDAVRRDRLYPLYLVALTTGMRRGEILGLTWDAVDLDQSRLFVRQALIAINYDLHLSTPKSKRSTRAVLLDAATVAALAQWRERQRQEQDGHQARDPDFVFTRPDGGPLHPHSVSQGFARKLKGSQLPMIRFHDLRHTSATLALAAGVHPKIVSERLGHASVTITLDTYSHVVPTLQEEAANQIAALIT